MKHAVIMTFPASMIDVYGYCFKGFIENWPKSVTGFAIVEEPNKLSINNIPDNLHILDFQITCGKKLQEFESRNSKKEIFNMQTGLAGNIQFQAAKFARKAFAQLYALETIQAETIWYIDADLYTHSKITEEFLDDLVFGDHYLGCTPRWWSKENAFTETGLIFWKKSMTYEHAKWCSLYSECYEKDKIFEFDAWHDCIAFDYATKSLINSQEISILDLGYGVQSSHPLVAGPLGKYFDHLKGDRKFIGKSSERRAHEENKLANYLTGKIKSLKKIIKR